MSALGTVYAMSGGTQEVAGALSPVIAHSWSLATGLSLLAWYVFAPQCLSTLAVVRRETNSWRYPLYMAAYLFALAYAGGVRHLPRGARARRRTSGMSGVLQGVVVGVAVAASVLYSTWRLGSARLRLRMLEALGRCRDCRRLPGFAAWYARALAQRAAGCGGCAPTGAPPRKQTPGALRRS